MTVRTNAKRRTLRDESTIYGVILGFFAVALLIFYKNSKTQPPQPLVRLPQSHPRSSSELADRTKTYGVTEEDSMKSRNQRESKKSNSYRPTKYIENIYRMIPQNLPSPYRLGLPAYRLNAGNLIS